MSVPFLQGCTKINFQGFSREDTLSQNLAL